VNTPDDLISWHHRLHAAGLSGMEESPLGRSENPAPERIAAFRDASGQRHPSMTAMLARLFNAGPSVLAESSDDSPDTVLWRAVLENKIYEHAAFSDDPGPLWPEGVNQGIEAWTLTELRGLHALWWLAVQSKSDSLRGHALECAAWHVAELQPDNATNRPWAVHVFAVLAAERDDAQADLYVQTLLHNALITGGGRPETVSAAILLDAADALKHERSVH